MPIHMKDHSLYYLCQSGEVKAKAQEYRAAFIRLKTALSAVVESLGCTKACVCDDMMLLRSVYFPRSIPVPDGWTKRDRDGCSRPKRLKENAEILKHFTPGGCYTVKQHPDLAAFQQWLGCPTSYRYTKGPNETGSSRIGDCFHPIQVLWYDHDTPICVCLPDVAKEKAEAIASGQTITDNVLDWTPPKGMKQIMREEWALMAAKHEKKQEAAK